TRWVTSSIKFTGHLAGEASASGETGPTGCRHSASRDRTPGCPSRIRSRLDRQLSFLVERRIARRISTHSSRSRTTDRTVEIYLPIADLPVNVFVILAMGLAVGFISGMFGIGGGFLMTPLLIFLGISPAVAVASVTGHIAASSCSGAISYWR